MSVHAYTVAARERARGYSEATGGAGLIAVSGQLPGTDALADGAGFAEQFGSALERLVEVLAAADAEPADLLILRIYVTDIEAYRSSLGELGPIYRDTLRGVFPATTLVEVSALVDERAVVEVEALAVQP